MINIINISWGTGKCCTHFLCTNFAAWVRIYRCYVASEGVMQKCCTRKKKNPFLHEGAARVQKWFFFLPSAAFLHHTRVRYVATVFLLKGKIWNKYPGLLEDCHPALGNPNAGWQPGAIFIYSDAHTSIGAHTSKGADSKSEIRFALAHLPMLDGNPGAVFKNSDAHAPILNQRCWFQIWDQIFSCTPPNAGWQSWSSFKK